MAQANPRPLIKNAPGSEATVARVLECHEADPRNVHLAMTFDELLGDGGMADETADDMIRAIRGWRDVTSPRDLD